MTITPAAYTPTIDADQDDRVRWQRRAGGDSGASRSRRGLEVRRASRRAAAASTAGRDDHRRSVGNRGRLARIDHRPIRQRERQHRKQEHADRRERPDAGGVSQRRLAGDSSAWTIAAAAPAPPTL